MLKDLLYRPSQTPAESYQLAVKAFKIDPEQDLRKVKSRIGMEASLSYAHLYFSNAPRFKRLKRELDLHQREYNQLNSEVDVLIVSPPRGSFRPAALKRWSKQVLGLSLTAGFAHVSHAQLNSSNAVEGARRLTQLVEEKRRHNRQLILISLSFGSAFVRLMLDHMPKEERTHVKGWLNMSGLIFGSPRFHCSNKKKLVSAMNLPRRSFSSEQRYFLKPLNLTGVKTVHVLGIQSSSTMNFSEVRQREYLKAWGPNDGMIPLARYQNVQGAVLTLLNQGHLIDVSSFGSTFVKILSSMVSTIPLDNRPSLYQPQLNRDFI